MNAKENKVFIVILSSYVWSWCFIIFLGRGKNYYQNFLFAKKKMKRKRKSGKFSLSSPDNIILLFNHVIQLIWIFARFAIFSCAKTRRKLAKYLIRLFYCCYKYIYKAVYTTSVAGNDSLEGLIELEWLPSSISLFLWKNIPSHINLVKKFFNGDEVWTSMIMVFFE